MSLNVTASNLKNQHVPDSFNDNVSKSQIDVRPQNNELIPSQNKVTDDDNKALIDASYKEKRNRNNASAKKSRDARLKREEAITVRAIATENENIALKARIQLLEDEVRGLRNILYKQQQHTQNENIELTQHASDIKNIFKFDLMLDE